METGGGIQNGAGTRSQFDRMKNLYQDFQARPRFQLRGTDALRSRAGETEESQTMGTNSFERTSDRSLLRPQPIDKDAEMLDNRKFVEKHYRIAELAELWGLGRETIRKMLIDEPGVVKIRLGRKKAHTTYTVPDSVARRIHSRLSR